jgi:GPH family glycoside/pentoside/hexuronide:cation symporter
MDPHRPSAKIEGGVQWETPDSPESGPVILEDQRHNLSPSYVPEKDRVALRQKVAYGLGGPLEGLASGIPLSNLTPVFNVGLGMSPGLLGLVLLLWRTWDACTDLFMGNMSDNARTRWGRRRPFIIAGAILTGLTMPLIWWAPLGMSQWATFTWLLITGMIFYTCFSLWGMPYYSLQLEMSPDYNERTNITAYRAFAQQIFSLIGGWILALAARPLFSTHPDHSPDLVNGMKYISIGLGALALLLGILPGLFVKERYYAKDASKQSKEDIWTGLKQTLTTKPFLCLLAITFTKTFGFALINTLGFYLNTYYVCRGNLMLATTITGVVSSVLYLPNLAAIPLCTWLANRLGKRAMLFIIVCCAIVGTLSMIVFITPTDPWLQIIPALLISPIGAGLWLVAPSMQADVADYDELVTSQRREGSFSAVFSWTLKASNALASGLGGLLLITTGFDISHGSNQSPQVLGNLRLFYIGVPLCFLVLCLFAIGTYDLSRERMLDIRRQLEAKRGVI